MMWKWRQRRNTAPVAETLHGAPIRPRVKTYSAADGFVYQYVHRGWRESQSQPGKDYVFDVTRTGASKAPVYIRILSSEVKLCSAAAGREISATEEYAITKMALFALFDEDRAAPDLPSTITPSADQMQAWLHALDQL